MNSLFPPELRTASIVSRWSIVRTLQRPDTVAEHSFYVVFYALQVARLIGWAGPYADLSYMALMHDACHETFTGDMLSPVKHAVLDEGKYANYTSEQMKLRLPLVEPQIDAIMESQWGSNIERIIKVADKVDAALFLILEQRMGNAMLEPLYQDALQNLVVAWHDLGVELYGDRVSATDAHRATWNEEIYPALQAHWKHGGNGIT